MANLKCLRLRGYTTGSGEACAGDAAASWLNGKTKYTILLRYNIQHSEAVQDEPVRYPGTNGPRFIVNNSDCRWSIPTSGGATVDAYCNAGTSGSPVTNDQWYDTVVVVDLDAGTVETYVPGSAVGSGAKDTVAISTGSHPTASGTGSIRSSANETDWDWAELAFWDGKLTASEIDGLQSVTADQVSTSASLLKHWKADTESTGTATGSDTNLQERVTGSTDPLDGISGSPYWVDDGPAVDDGVAGAVVGEFYSCAIPTSGATATLIFDKPGGSGTWDSPFTVSNDPRDWPYFSVNSASDTDRANLLHTESVGTPTVDGSGRLNVPLTLTGYAGSGEDVDIKLVASAGALVTDADGDETEAFSSESCTNNSLLALEAYLTRMKGLPKIAWATQSYWPFTGATARIAMFARDGWNGVASVRFTFDTPVTLVSDAYVSGTSPGTQFTIAGRRLIDLFGYGEMFDYWYLDLDISGASDGVVATITEVRVTLNSGVTFDLVALGRMDECVIFKRTSETVRYLDANASGAADGTSWEDAWTDLSTAEAGVDAAITKVLVAPGTYTEASMTFDQSRTLATHGFIVWEKDETGPNGDGVVVFDFSGTTNFKTGQALKGIDMLVAAGDSLRTASASGVRWEDSTWSYADKSGSPFVVNAATNWAIVHCTQYGGLRGPSLSAVSGVRPTRGIIHAFTMSNSGTGIKACIAQCLIEGFRVSDAATEGFGTGVHFDAIHPFTTLTLSGANFTHATNTITKAGAFADLTGEVVDIQLSAGTGAATGVAYRVLSYDDDNLVLDRPIAAGDISDNSVGGSVYEESLIDSVIRGVEVVNSGHAGDGNSYPFILIDQPAVRSGIYGCRSHSHLGSQQVVQIQGRTVELEIEDCVLLDSNAVGNSDDRGVNLSGSGCGTYTQIGLLIRNNILNTLVSTTASHPSGEAPLDGQNYRKCILGPNMYSQQDADPQLTYDGSAQASESGNDAFGLTNLDGIPFDFSPASADAEVITGINRANSDTLFDAAGQPIASHGYPLAVGAFQFLPKAADIGDPVTMGNVHGRLVNGGTHLGNHVVLSVAGGITISSPADWGIPLTRALPGTDTPTTLVQAVSPIARELGRNTPTGLRRVACSGNSRYVNNRSFTMGFEASVLSKLAGVGGVTFGKFAGSNRVIGGRTEDPLNSSPASNSNNIRQITDNSANNPYKDHTHSGSGSTKDPSPGPGAGLYLAAGEWIIDGPEARDDGSTGLFTPDREAVMVAWVRKFAGAGTVRVQPAEGATQRQMVAAGATDDTDCDTAAVASHTYSTGGGDSYDSGTKTLIIVTATPPSIGHGVHNSTGHSLAEIEDMTSDGNERTITLRHAFQNAPQDGDVLEFGPMSDEFIEVTLAASEDSVIHRGAKFEAVGGPILLKDYDAYVTGAVNGWVFYPVGAGGKGYGEQIDGAFTGNWEEFYETREIDLLIQGFATQNSGEDYHDEYHDLAKTGRPTLEVFHLGDPTFGNATTLGNTTSESYNDIIRAYAAAQSEGAWCPLESPNIGDWITGLAMGHYADTAHPSMLLAELVADLARAQMAGLLASSGSAGGGGSRNRSRSRARATAPGPYL